MTLTKRFLIGLSSLALGASVTACGGGNKASGCPDCDAEITVGILHSLSGTMAISESTLVDTEKMAIEEINASGGIEVAGKKYEIKYIVEDGASDWPQPAPGHQIQPRVWPQRRQFSKHVWI